MPVFVTGHRNPDTDSIVSAIAYAALKNALGERDVEPVCLGEVNAETAVVLGRFGFEAPRMINNVKTQVHDVAFDRPPIVGSGVTVRTAWNIMIEHGCQSVCIADENGRLVGKLASADIAEHDMNSALDGYFVDTTAFNLASALEGYLLGKGDDWDMVRGSISIAVHGRDYLTAEHVGGCVLIAGDREGLVTEAEKAKVSCLILCEVDADSVVAKEAAAANLHVVLTHYDPYRASRLISHSMPVSRLMKTEDIISFHIDDFLDDVREVMQRHRVSDYPILDQNEKVIGLMTRYHLFNHKKKQVILVDHNEPQQSVVGLEQAELLEIVDHHRLGDIETNAPLSIRMEPVGSATTIVASMFFEHGVTPGVNLAGLMTAAILSDTVLFKSPTCTEKDRRMAHRMAQLAGIDVQQLGIEIFSAATNIAQSTPKELLFRDYKEFILGDYRVGIGQVTCMDVHELDEMDEALISMMEVERVERKLDILLFMETEIVNGGTRLLFTGKAENVLEDAFEQKVMSGEHSIFLAGMMSRKKQMVPAISAVLA